MSHNKISDLGAAYNTHHLSLCPLTGPASLAFALGPTCFLFMSQALHHAEGLCMQPRPQASDGSCSTNNFSRGISSSREDQLTLILLLNDALRPSTIKTCLGVGYNLVVCW